jgi:hypothetical protein
MVWKGNSVAEHLSSTKEARTHTEADTQLTIISENKLKHLFLKKTDKPKIKLF